MKKIVFMFSRQRSGTNALNSILNQHNDILCTWEIFDTQCQNEQYRFFNYINKLNKPYLYIISHKYELFDDFIKFIINSTSKNNIIIDVKYNSINSINSIWYSHFNSKPVLIKYLYEHDCYVFQLTRKNYLDQYISIIRSNMTKEYTNKSCNSKNFSFTLDINDFNNFIRASKAEDEYIRNLLWKSNKFITLDYYELFDNNKLSRYAVKVFHEYLNIDGLDNIKSVYNKIIKDKYDIINNENTVRKFCKDNNYEYFLW